MCLIYVRQASKQLAVLMRLWFFNQTKQTFFISSNLSYCLLAWHYCSASSTKELQKIQERVLRFINNDHTSTLSAFLEYSNTQPLHVRRLKQMACEDIKIVNNMSPDYINDLVKIKKSNYYFREERKTDVYRVNTTRFELRSFRSEPAGIWNSLPNKYDWSNRTHSFVGWSMLWTALGMNALFVLPYLCRSVFV